MMASDHITPTKSKKIKSKIKICMIISCSCPWTTFDKLQQLGGHQTQPPQRNECDPQEHEEHIKIECEQGQIHKSPGVGKCLLLDLKILLGPV